MLKILLGSLGFAFFVFFPFLASSEDRSYFYEIIHTDIVVNEDTTLNVVEHQIFSYRGKYNQAVRSIPLKSIDSIFNVRVKDGETGEYLKYIPLRQEKSNPESWGNYTTYKKGGVFYIEWYYNLSDTTYEWVIEYKVLGAIEFRENHDRLYWNIFSDYQVPISEASVGVHFPVSVSGLEFTSYRNQDIAVDSSLNADGVFFKSKNFVPQESFTIDIGWAKGYIKRNLYWVLFAKDKWGYGFGIFIFLAAVIYAVLRWFKREYLKEGRGTIVPQYDPPKNLRPGMMEVILKEKVGVKVWPATIVDLAVRGYLEITEEEKGRIEKALEGFYKWIVFAIIFCIFIFMFLGGLSSIYDMAIFSNFISLGLLMLIVLITTTKFLSRGFIRAADYIITRTDKEPSGLESFESSLLTYLGLWGRGSKPFSTKELRKDLKMAQKLFIRLTSLKEEFYKEVDADTNAYKKPVQYKTKSQNAISGSLGLLVIGVLVAFASPVFNQLGFLVMSACSAALLLWTLIKYNPELSYEGHVLKEEILGFKMYLETAERYRLQNLTPDLFEKFLPYAMIFGVEKKWAKAFSSISVPPPSWYHGGSSAHFSSGVGSGGLSGFSAGAFSASFSSSFSSAFSSSSGGGSGVGGGGAGGGGGGGGGGAS